jgi:adenylate cyclase
MPLTLEAIRGCLEGVIPSAVATCAADGTPNVSIVSQVHFVDCNHVALSFQFFNKTRQNVLANPRAAALVIDPDTGAQYRLEIEYLRTETVGPLFESMKAKLASIASHAGMTGVFRLLGSDVYRVLGIVAVPGNVLPPPAPRRNMLSALRLCADRLTQTTDLGRLLDDALASIDELFDIRHAMILMLDGSGRRLYTVASRGYPLSGIGSEIAVGCGVIGVAAAERTPIRIMHMTSEYSYGRAIRDSVEKAGLGRTLETAIPFPGLPDSRSQVAVPVTGGGRLLGVLFAESSEDLRFGYDDEDALVAITAQLGMAILVQQQTAETHDEAPVPASGKAAPQGATVVVRHYPTDDSVFVGDDYLIKGVAGAIVRKLVRDYLATGRTEFSNRELRLDPSIRLPDISDNLEARLVLLERRLGERCPFLRIEKTGRGRFRLVVGRPLTLAEGAG